MWLVSELRPFVICAAKRIPFDLRVCDPRGGWLYARAAVRPVYATGRAFLAIPRWGYHTRSGTVVVNAVTHHIPKNKPTNSNKRGSHPTGYITTYPAVSVVLPTLVICHHACPVGRPSVGLHTGFSDF